MGVFLLDTGIFIALLILWIVQKVMGARLSLTIAITGAIFFALHLLFTLAIERFNISPVIYLLICSIFIIAGGKQVAYKTQTGVFDQITGRPTRVMRAGSLNWSDPLLDVTTVDVNGTPNVSADLQELMIEILETPEMQTLTRGIKAKVKHIVFMLHLHGNLRNLFNIEGGAQTVRKRINSFVLEFFLDKIGQTNPQDLDQDKGHFLRVLAEELKVEVNRFCGYNHYPYEIPLGSTVTIGDTELEVAYYEALAKKALAILDQDAEDEIAKRITKRLKKRGKKLLPSGSEAEQLEAARISLKIVPKSINENKYSVDADLRQLLKDIAMIMKK